MLINNQAEVDGAANPFADIRVRQALALATDNEMLKATRTAGLFPVANGPFPQGVGQPRGHRLPDLRPGGRPALLEEVEADTGAPVAIAYKTTTDPFNLTTAELLKDDVGGGRVHRHDRPDPPG